MTSSTRRPRRTAPAVVLAFLLGCALTMAASAAGPSALAASDPTPVPLTNPFSEPVGGELLGRSGVALEADDVPELPDETAQAFVVADLDTGEVLAAKDAHEYLDPGGTLHILTALTLLPRLDPRAVYTVSQDDVDVEGPTAGLTEGVEYTIDDLFYGLFLRTGSDAATALARAGGVLGEMADLMNIEAARLGAFDTQAVNPRGEDDAEQQSSAYDLALLARAGLADEAFLRYAGTPVYDLSGTDDNGDAAGADGGQEPNTDGSQIANTNNLLLTYSGAFGVISGARSAAENTIVGVAEQDDRRLLVSVVQTEEAAWEEATRLLDWGFAAVGDIGEDDMVGQLVTAEDVAAASDSGQGDTPVEPAEATPTRTTPTPDAGGESAGDGGSSWPSRLTGLLDPSLLMLLGLAAIFAVLAGSRVRTVLLDRRAAEPEGSRRASVGGPFGSEGSEERWPEESDPRDPDSPRRETRGPHSPRRDADDD